MLYITNTYYGRKFFKDGREWIVTWDDKEYLRATPANDPTGLKSMEFKIDEVKFIDN